MKEIIQIASLVLYLIVGIVSLLMAYKSIFSLKFLPFHEEAYGNTWENVDKNLQFVILALMRVSGLGFLIMGVFLLACPVYLFLTPNIFLRFLIPLLALPYCCGLFIFNYILFKKTKAKTPWKNSLLAMIIIIISAVLSVI